MMLNEESIQRLREAIEGIERHAHPRPGQGPDLYCLNLSSWLGERMSVVLDALIKVDNQRKKLIAELDELHVKEAAGTYAGMDTCEHCRMLCHSREGLSCDTDDNGNMADGAWPCATMKIVEKYR